MPLHHFLRLIGGGRVIERDAAANNDELVSALKRRGIITQQASPHLSKSLLHTASACAHCLTSKSLSHDEILSCEVLFFFSILRP